MTNMRATVLRPFAYSRDGLTCEDLTVGQTVEIRDDLAPGLEAEGFIRKAGLPRVPPAVIEDIPAARGPAVIEPIPPATGPVVIKDLGGDDVFDPELDPPEAAPKTQTSAKKRK